MNNDGIIFSRDWWQVARRIRSDADRARYLMAILDYAYDGTEPADEQLDVLTLQARMYIDRQREAYAEKVEKTRASARARYAKDANACGRMRTHADEGNQSLNLIKSSIKEKESADALSKKKAQQAAPGASRNFFTDDLETDTLPSEHQAEKEKGSAEKEKEPDVLPVEVVTVRPRRAPSRSAPAFVPPTVAEVAAYCAERQNGIDAEEFVAVYAQAGWRLKGGRPMKDWKSAVITWEKYRKRNLINEHTSNYDREKARRDAEFARYFGPGGPGRHE